MPGIRTLTRKTVVAIFLICSVISYAQNNKEKTFLLTQDIIHHLENQQYDSIAAHFDSTMLRQMDGEKLKEAWEILPYHFGDLVAFQKITIDTLPGFIISLTPIQFKNAKLVMSLSFNAKLEIAGLYFRPKYTYVAPEYVNTLAFTEYKITFGKEPYLIAGTLTVPNKVKDPSCAIIVGGSGPTDRDMSYGENKPYKDIAWGLACKGVAVLRFDKRNFSYGSQLLTDKYAGKNFTIREEYLDDVKDAVAYAMASKKVDPKRIFLIGHSEGGMLAPLLAEQNKKVAGIILMAANARNMLDLLVEQLDFLAKDSSVSSAQKVYYEALKRHARLAKDPNLKSDFPEDSLPGATAAYWIALNSYHPLETVKKIRQPMLFLQGERDYQVPLTDLNLWKEALKTRTNCLFRSYPKLNHHFIEGEGPPHAAEYEKHGSVPEYVVDDIAGWIKSFPMK
jgi:fermentation-respiration switch protein FrsA (DUF1100 family)